VKSNAKQDMLKVLGADGIVDFEPIVSQPQVFD
jgi:hypothetical protein